MYSSCTHRVGTDYITTILVYKLSSHGIYYHDNFSHCRKVGNIFDNPEYLEKSSKDLFKRKYHSIDINTATDYIDLLNPIYNTNNK